jgi:hypothetical protein
VTKIFKVLVKGEFLRKKKNSGKDSSRFRPYPSIVPSIYTSKRGPRSLNSSSSVMTHACPTWEYAAGAHHLKLQRLQNRVLRATGNLDRCTPVRELHVAFKIPYVCDYITKLYRKQTEVILNHVNPNVHAIGQGEARHRKNKRLKLVDVWPTSFQLINWSFKVVPKLRHNLLHKPALADNLCIPCINVY